jgi:hypothetical protein
MDRAGASFGASRPFVRGTQDMPFGGCAAPRSGVWWHRGGACPLPPRDQPRPARRPHLRVAAHLPARPSLCPTPMPQGWPGLSFVANGGRRSTAPHCPSVRLAKHTPPPKISPIWARKKSPIFVMCSGPPRYYNEFIVGPGAPSSPSEERRPGFSLFVPAP